MRNQFDQFYECSGVCTDTRAITKDCLFVALKGANFDGNQFALQAIELGAKYVVVDDQDLPSNEKLIVVKNSLIFLQQLANHHRKKFSIPVIGITGSNGKTSTKELINVVLSKKYNVLATIGNLNNHIGVPLTLLRMSNDHEVAIIEMGANKPGDIKELCDIAEPNLGIITNIGKAHLEGFKNFEGVLNTKTELYRSIAAVRGEIVFNEDDEVLKNNLPHGTIAHSYGVLSKNILGQLLRLTPFIEMQWSTGSYHSPVLSTQMLGKYNFYNFLAAITFGKLLEVPNELINEALVGYVPTNNRSQLKKTESNTLIMDCYNANPTSVKSALESFALIEDVQKMFILGDMLELGNESLNEHQQVLNFAQEKGLSGYTVGPIFSMLSSGSVLNKFGSCEEAEHYLQGHKIQNKLILLKGSRGIGLEKLETVL